MVPPACPAQDRQTAAVCSMISKNLSAQDTSWYTDRLLYENCLYTG